MLEKLTKITNPKQYYFVNKRMTEFLNKYNKNWFRKIKSNLFVNIYGFFYKKQLQKKISIEIRNYKDEIEWKLNRIYEADKEIKEIYIKLHDILEKQNKAKNYLTELGYTEDKNLY